MWTLPTIQCNDITLFILVYLCVRINRMGFLLIVRRASLTHLFHASREECNHLKRDIPAMKKLLVFLLKLGLRHWRGGCPYP